MKKLVVTVILMTLVLAAGAQADQPIASRIKKVTLYSDRALVTREAVTTIPKGVNTLLIELEAFRVDKDAVLARVFGEGAVYGVQYRETPVIESPREEIRKIEQQIEALEKRRQGVLNQKNVLAKKALFLDSVIEFSKTQVPQEIKTAFPRVEQMQNTLSFLGDNYTQIYMEQLAHLATVQELDKEIDLLQKKLNQLQKPADSVRQMIEVVFFSQKPQEIRIEADYLTLNTGWTPLYKASVAESLTSVELTMFANVFQKTGENWPQVALAISNIVPLKGGSLPSLPTWVIDLPRPILKMRQAAGSYAPSPAEQVMDAFKEEAEAAPETEAELMTAIARERPLAFEYTLARPLDIESRDKETIVPLLNKSLEGEFYYYTAPKHTPLTFLVCEARADAELLAGPMNIYFGGQYIGKTRIDSQTAGDAFRLNLGAVREIMVKRERVSDKIKETYFGKLDRSTVVRSLVYKITVDNRKDRRVKVKLVDHIPVSRTDKIEIRDLKMIPLPTAQNYMGREGVMLWEYELNPQETRELSIEFDVVHPKESPPQGL